MRRRLGSVEARSRRRVERSRRRSAPAGRDGPARARGAERLLARRPRRASGRARDRSRRAPLDVGGGRGAGAVHLEPRAGRRCGQARVPLHEDAERLLRDPRPACHRPRRANAGGQGRLSGPGRLPRHRLAERASTGCCARTAPRCPPRRHRGSRRDDRPARHGRRCRHALPPRACPPRGRRRRHGTRRPSAGEADRPVGARGARHRDGRAARRSRRAGRADRGRPGRDRPPDPRRRLAGRCGGRLHGLRAQRPASRRVSSGRSTPIGTATPTTLRGSR